MAANDSTPLTTNAAPPHKKRNIFIVVSTVLLLVCIAIGVYLLNQQLSYKKDAAVGKTEPNQDSCGYVKIDVTENPSCPRLTDVDTTNGNQSVISTGTNPVSSYTTTYKVTNISSEPRTVQYHTLSYYCSSKYATVSKVKDNEWDDGCVENEVRETKSVSVNPGQTADITVTRNSPSGMACGTYQTDFGIDSIDNNNSCNYLGPQDVYYANLGIAAAGLCETGVTCVAPTPTPTVAVPTPTSTPVPTTAPVSTATPTPSPTRMPTTATPSPTPTPTVGPGTPTPTTVAGATATPTSVTPTETVLVRTNTNTPTATTPTIPSAGTPGWLLVGVPVVLVIISLLF